MASQRLLKLALELIEIGEDAKAEAALRGNVLEDEATEAERLALLGFLEARKGNPVAYRTLAQQAAQKYPTPLTLYHWGLSLPPKEGLPVLKEALDRFRGLPEAEGRLAYALARTLRRMGRFREALSWASLAALRIASPFYLLEELALETLAGEKPLGALEKALAPLQAHGARGVRLHATWLQVWLRLMNGDRVSDLLSGLLALLPAHNLAYVLPLAVIALKKEEEKEDEIPSCAT